MGLGGLLGQVLVDSWGSRGAWRRLRGDPAGGFVMITKDLA
jgi:hypothetical protein